MKDYLIVYRSGKTESVSCPDKKSLIEMYFKGDESQFKKEVQLLKWNTLTMMYSEDISQGKINAEISTADANPYGWRG